MTITFVDEDITVSNILSFESTSDGMVLSVKKNHYPRAFDRRLGLGHRTEDGDVARESLPPWRLRLEITPDTEQAA